MDNGKSSDFTVCLTTCIEWQCQTKLSLLCLSSVTFWRAEEVNVLTAVSVSVAVDIAPAGSSSTALATLVEALLFTRTTEEALDLCKPVTLVVTARGSCECSHWASGQACLISGAHHLAEVYSVWFGTLLRASSRLRFGSWINGGTKYDSTAY